MRKAVGLGLDTSMPVAVLGVELMKIGKRAFERMSWVRPMTRDQEMPQLVPDREPATLA